MPDHTGVSDQADRREPSPPQPTLYGSGGNRLTWAELPDAVRAAIEERLGAGVVGAHSQAGGFSPGMASRLVLSDGRIVFVKAVGADPNPDAPEFYRREARIAAQLPATVPAPVLLWCHDQGDWVVLAFENVDGRPPVLPWRRDERDRVLAALTGLAVDLTPPPADIPPLADELVDTLAGWRKLAVGPVEALDGLDSWARERLAELVDLESRWPAAAAGNALVHGDMRADNMLLTDDRVVFVDWPSAALGAPWFDLLIMMPSLSQQGGGDPELIVTEHPLTRGVDPAAITSVLAAVTGYFVYQCRQPPPPGLPRVRDFQRAQGEAALCWLRQRLGA